MSILYKQASGIWLTDLEIVSVIDVGGKHNDLSYNHVTSCYQIWLIKAAASRKEETTQYRY